MKQFTTAKQLLELTEPELEELWQWANRTKEPKKWNGIDGMPLLSIGRCIEFLIDYKVPLKQFMGALAIDYHDYKGELIDKLWDSIKLILKASKQRVSSTGKVEYRFVPKRWKAGGTMQQWVTRTMWKQLTDGERLKLYTWNHKRNGFDYDIYQAPSTDFGATSYFNVPMMSIGVILKFLLDSGLSLKEVFEYCSKFEKKEWSKRQLLDVLWDKVKLVLKTPLQLKENTLG